MKPRAQRDFNGTTGRAQLRYAPSAKVLLRFAAYRELQAIEDLSASYALVRVANWSGVGADGQDGFSSVVYLRGADV